MEIAEIKELEAFLYPTISNNFPLIQKIYAKKNKKVLFWNPGKTYNINNLKNINTCSLLGYTGKTYEKNITNITNKSYYLHWLGIDVDDIKDIEKTSLIISFLLPDANIRLSTGGNGLHLLHRIEPLYFSYEENIGKIVQTLQIKWVKQLEEANIKVCKYDNRTFFLFGGNNKWLKQTNKILKINKAKELRQELKQELKQETNDKLAFNSLAPEIKKILKTLQNKEVKGIWIENVPTLIGIWIKEVYEALKNTEYHFKTSSPMASNYWHINGFIKITKNEIIIKGHADNKICYSLFDDSDLFERNIKWN